MRSWPGWTARPWLRRPDQPDRDATLSEPLWPDLATEGTASGTASGTTAAAPTARVQAKGRSYVIRCDGASRSNPGHAAAGAVLIDASRPDALDPSARPDATISEYLGIQTNNVAEYTAVLRALALATELGAREVHLLLDSKLIVEQLHARWRVMDSKLAPLHAETRRLLSGFERWSAAHVPRAQNHAADELCNMAIDRALAGGPRSVVVRPRA
jgi:ribonuclease HI